jgi:hypothetical protein
MDPWPPLGQARARAATSTAMATSVADSVSTHGRIGLPARAAHRAGAAKSNKRFEQASALGKLVPYKYSLLTSQRNGRCVRFRWGDRTCEGRAAAPATGATGPPGAAPGRCSWAMGGACVSIRPRSPPPYDGLNLYRPMCFFMR